MYLLELVLPLGDGVAKVAHSHTLGRVAKQQQPLPLARARVAKHLETPPAVVSPNQCRPLVSSALHDRETYLLRMVNSVWQSEHAGDSSSATHSILRCSATCGGSDMIE